MKVRGAYMTLKEFLFTYKKGAVYTEKGDGAQDSWYLDENRELIIPDYQREYRWGDKQLTELISDINKDQCYLGQIAISQKVSTPQTYNIIDGQQRITSIIILYTILVRQLCLHRDQLYVEEYDLHKRDNNKDNPSIARLNFKTNCFSDFQSFVAQVYELDDDAFLTRQFTPPTIDDYEQQSRYIDACITLHKEISKYINIRTGIPSQLSFVREFLDKILKTRISLVVFESDEVYESERVFLDINEKGLRLDNEDILKAYYFQRVPTQYGSEALETWKQLKKSYCNLKPTISKKIPLETFVNIALQTELLMTDSSLEYNKFDSELRYKEPNGKKHISELFIPTELHNTIKRIVLLFEDLCKLSQQDSNSSFYVNYFPGRDSTSRNIFKLLYNPIIKSGMTIVYIALIKFWWLRKKNNEHLTIEDVVQLFSFYIISNVSGLKKERILFDTDFVSASSEKETYKLLYVVEAEMLSNATSNSSTLKSDQDKGEYLSFNIQMFYNDFQFNSTSIKWEINIRNQEFLEKYNATRKNYVKDHFIIQNGDSIKLYNNKIFTLTQRLKMLRKRAYNFIYHYDDYGNMDFISRLHRIYQDNPTKTYGQYELDYFEYIVRQLKYHFDIDNQLSANEAREKICEEYSKVVPNRFDPIVSFILETNIFSWNQSVCKHFLTQFPSQIMDLVNKA